MRRIVLALIFVGILFAGCRIVEDQSTGKKTYGLDPNNSIVKVLDAAADIGTGVGAALLPFLGGTTALGLSAAVGVLGAWRKVAPQLKTARTLASQTMATTTALVTAIETFKTMSPDAWTVLGDRIKEELTHQGVDAAEIKNIINQIRLSLSGESSA